MVKRLLLGIAVLCLVFIALVAHQWFGPAPPIVVSRQTTFITEPLSKGGLPNFAEAILQRQREGATPENNAAVPFWQAMGPGEMSAEDFSRVANEIGLDWVQGSSTLAQLDDKSLMQRLVDWIVQQRETGADGANPVGDGEPATVDEDEAVADESGAYGGISWGDVDENDAESVADRQIEFAKRSPWTGADVPPLARWVAENQQPLDLLLEAADKPEWYSPSPSMLKRPPDSIIATQFSDIIRIRSAAWALSARAMFHIGADDYEAAWQDTRACWRLGEHAAGEWTLVAKFVGIVIRGRAKKTTLQLLNRPDLPQPLATKILDDLNQLQSRVDVAEAMNFGERLYLLDSVFQICSGESADWGDLAYLTSSEDLLLFLGRGPIDGHIVLRSANKWYDKLNAAAAEQDYAKRQSKLAHVESELDELDSFDSNPAVTVAGAILSRQRRSEAVGDILLQLLIPSVSAASRFADRDQASMTLARTAAALAVYRLEHGDYPDTLAALTPELLPALPIDLFAGAPLIYQRRREGYLLYSVGANGTNEGGDDRLGSAIVDGEWVDENAEDYETTEYGEGDYVIRLPLPTAHIPEIQLPAAEPTDSESSAETGDAEAQTE